MMTADLAQKPVLTGRKVLFMFAAFFGTIASADAILITSAVRSWSGAETTSAYKAGQLYNSEIALAQAQDARGWALASEAARQADGSVRVSVAAKDRLGAPLTRRAVTATLQRPTDKRADRTVELGEGAAGSYAALLFDLAPGQWDLVVDVVEEGERAFRRKTRVVLP
jgi:nitrogen fixation protein FixH